MMIRTALAMLMLVVVAMSARAGDPVCLTGPDSRVSSILIELPCASSDSDPVYYAFKSNGEQYKSFRLRSDVPNPLREDFPPQKIYIATATSSACVNGEAKQHGDHCRGDYELGSCVPATYVLRVKAPEGVKYAVRRGVRSADQKITCSFFFDNDSLAEARHPDHAKIQFEVYGDELPLIKEDIDLAQQKSKGINRKMIEDALSAEEKALGQTGGGLSENARYVIEKKRAALKKLGNVEVKVSAVR